ncbi:MAG: transglutaminase domain-containing protein [Thermoguttaceae bacterium]|jgi:hypothetical protein
MLVVLTLFAPAVRADAPACRTGRIDPRVARVPAEIQQAVFAQPETALAPLVGWLLGGGGNDFEKVKILHDWIAEYIAYDADTFLAGTTVDSSWQNTLRRRKAVCQGYAALLEKMCALAGIPCEIISGYGRGYGFALAAAENVRKTNHAWNAVYLQGQWYLVDATWDAGHLEQRSFRKGYGTAYLFLDPQQFLYAHFPADPRWQLIRPACTAERFAQLPYLEGRFFEQHLRLATPLRRFHPVGESVQLTIEAPPDIVLTARLQDPAGVAQSARRTLVCRQGAAVNILVTFPAPGPWNVEVLSKARQDPGPYWLAAKLELQASGGTPWTFPETFGSFAAMEAFLYSPLYVPLTTDKPQEFKIRVRGAEEVHLRIGGRQWLPMKTGPEEKEVYRATATIPRDTAVQIVAKQPGQDASHWTLVDFTPEGTNGRDADKVIR